MSIVLEQVEGRLPATLALAAGFCRAARPALTLAVLHGQVPCSGHVALDFAVKSSAACSRR